MSENLKLTALEPLILPLVPEGVRGQMTTLWDVHARLSSLSISGNEPALRQIRLAWWRDSLMALDRAKVPPAEPLLERVRVDLLPLLSAAALADLAEARLSIVAEDWAVAAVAAYGETLFSLSASLLGDNAGGGGAWALVEAALAGAEDQRLALLTAARAQSPARTGPRVLRALDQLALQIARHDGQRSRGREQLLVLRVGLFGR